MVKEFIKLNLGNSMLEGVKKRLMTDLKIETAINIQKNSKHQRMKQILQTNPKDRSYFENEELGKMLREIKFFKDRQSMTDNNYQDIVNVLQFEEANQFEDVVTYGEVGEKFYIIIKGSCSVNIPNPAIKDWKYMKKQYDELVNWRRQNFDKKVE